VYEPLRDRKRSTANMINLLEAEIDRREKERCGKT